MRPVFQLHAAAMPARKVFFFSGIATNLALKKHINGHFKCVQWTIFPDHFRYTHKVLKQKIIDAYRKFKDPELILLTTEKDRARLVSLDGAEETFGDIPLYYLPIKMQFMNKEDEFGEKITKVVRQQNKSKSV
jgi:tetraacyldisaccharide 4'-kinase